MAKQGNTQRGRESQALYFAFGVFGISLLLSGILFYDGVVPIFARQSMGTTSALFGALAAFVAVFVADYIRGLESATKRGFRKALDTLAKKVLLTGSLAFVHGAIAFLMLSGVFYLLNLAFQGLQFDWVTASVVAASSVAVGGYITYISAMTMNTVKLSAVLAMFVVSGALTSMITAQDKDWWQLHFSSLGASDSFSSLAFNLTLIMGGLVIITLADYIAKDFGKLKVGRKRVPERNVAIIRWALSLIGFFLACVGIFEYDTRVAIHNSTAGGMAIVFVALVLGLSRLAPLFSRAFYVFSYSLMAGLVFAFWLFNGPLHYLNLTAFELTAAAVIFGWLVVFIRQIAATIQDQNN